MKLEETLIQTIIRHSKNVLMLKLAKLYLINTLESVKRSERKLFLFNSEICYDIEREINRRIKEINHHIRDLMYPLHQSKNFGYSNDMHEQYVWNLSQTEMKQGFVRLELERQKEPLTGKYIGFPIYYILFLSNYKDSKYNIQEGSLQLENDVIPILSNQKDVFGNYDIDKLMFNTLKNIYKK